MDVEALVKRLRDAARGLCTENPDDYIPRNVSAKDCLDAADALSAISARVAELEAQLSAADKHAYYPNGRRKLFTPAALPKGEPGWKLVPLQPTDAMIEAAFPCFVAPTDYSARKAWSAMLAAAPPARPGAYYDKEGNLIGTYTRKRKRRSAGDER